MKKLLTSLLVTLSFSANAYTIQDMQKEMKDDGFMLNVETMKYDKVYFAWQRSMSRYQCDLYVNTVLKEYPASQKVTNTNTDTIRIEMVTTHPGLLLSCSDNATYVWLTK
jgi:hypothetical protein